MDPVDPKVDPMDPRRDHDLLQFCDKLCNKWIKSFSYQKAIGVSVPKKFLNGDMKCGMICLCHARHAAQLPVLNGRECCPTFHESSTISFNISYLGYYQNVCHNVTMYKI